MKRRRKFDPWKDSPAKRITELQQALEFYAHTPNWSPPRTGGVLAGCPRDLSKPSPVERDRGKLARHALGWEKDALLEAQGWPYVATI